MDGEGEVSGLECHVDIIRWWNLRDFPLPRVWP